MSGHVVRTIVYIGSSGADSGFGVGLASAELGDYIVVQGCRNDRGNGIVPIMADAELADLFCYP